MKQSIITFSLVLLLSSCQDNHEEPARLLVGSWAVPANHLFSYAEMYFHTDYTCFYFSMETGSVRLGAYQVYGNTLFCEGKAIGKLKRIHEKEILLISDTSTDTLYFIDDLIVDKNRLKNDEEFRMFIRQFSRRREKFYQEKSGIDLQQETNKRR